MEPLHFYSTDGTPIYLFYFGGSGERGSSEYKKSMAIHIDPYGEGKWRALLDGEAILKLIALLEQHDGMGLAFEISSHDEKFQACWLKPDDTQNFQLQFSFKKYHEQYSFETDELLTWEEDKAVLFAEELAHDMAEYTRWMSDLTRDEPQFLKRNAIAIEICDPYLKREIALVRLDGVSVSDAVRIIGNVARRGRIDLAVELLARLHGRGAIDLITARSVEIHHIMENPFDVSWDQLFMWAGLTIQRPRVEPALSRDDEVEDFGYSSYNYLACFEDAFEESFETINFATIDFRDTQARLRRLTENLDRHFNNVHYPEAESGTVVPNIALDEQHL